VGTSSEGPLLVGSGEDGGRLAALPEMCKLSVSWTIYQL
jgi:hypothetical protein